MFYVALFRVYVPKNIFAADGVIIKIVFQIYATLAIKNAIMKKCVYNRQRERGVFFIITGRTK